MVAIHILSKKTQEHCYWGVDVEYVAFAVQFPQGVKKVHGFSNMISDKRIIKILKKECKYMDKKPDSTVTDILYHLNKKKEGKWRAKLCK
jgi:hypothetical protein